MGEGAIQTLCGGLGTLAGNVFLSALVASMGVCLWSEGMARVRKAPANIFMIPGIIPLLPGGALYYTMSALIGGDMDSVLL